MNLHHLIMVTSQRHHMKTCDGNHGALERKFTGFFFFWLLFYTLGDSPMKFTRKCNLCMEHLVRLTLFAEGSGVFKAATKTSEMSHDLKHQKLP